MVQRTTLAHAVRPDKKQKPHVPIMVMASLLRAPKMQIAAFPRRQTQERIVNFLRLASLVPAVGALAQSGCTDTSASSDITTSPESATAVSELTRCRLAHRDDIRGLPHPLKARLCELASKPHTYRPAIAFSEADTPSQLFQYYLIDTHPFQPNVFTTEITGINDGTKPTATGPNGNQSTIGAVRVVLEPKPGKPTDPNDVRAVVDVFTDVSGLFVINNESGWYEGWMIHDVKVPAVDPMCHMGMSPRFGLISPADAQALAALGAGNNVIGNFFTVDGNTPHFPAASDVFPAVQTNTVGFPVSLGTFNASQQSDIHAYWELNPGTNWAFPTFELPATGGIPGTFAAGLYGSISSLLPGSGPTGIMNDPMVFGDDPNNPRDPDRAEVAMLSDIDRPEQGNPAHLERRNRFIPTNLANEIHLDVFLRVTSFEPGVGMPQRLFDAYAYEIAKVDANGDGVISFQEADIEGTSNGQPNTRLYLPATAFDRYAMTRELNDGLLAPRFAPSQRGYVMGGDLTLVTPAVSASVPRDTDDR